MEAVAPLREVTDLINEHGGSSFQFCYQCGICDVVCPWNRVTSFSMRKIVRQAAFGLTEIEQETIWRCTTCGTCPQRCPRGVDQIAAGVSLRRIATEFDVFPESVTPVVTVGGSLRAEGNPFDMRRAERAEWAAGLPVKPFEEGMEILYFPGCYLSYDPRLKKVAAATARLLDRAGVEFGILGKRESCCGESIRKTGNEAVFKYLARENIKAFVDQGVTRILVSSPHCLHTFKNEYPEFSVRFEVVHIAEYLRELIGAGRLAITGRYDKRVAYHDPCYLGRHNGVFDAPRELLERALGAAPVELPDHRQNSLCCGGGGGRIWMDTPVGERLSDLRLEQAVQTGAEVLATACPYCITNFTDSALRLEEGRSIEVRDLTEILAEVT